MFISECHNTTTHNSVLVSTLGKMNNLPEYWYIHMWKQTSIAPHTIYYYFVIFSALNHSFTRLFIRYMYINTSKPTSVAVKESITRRSFFYKKKNWMNANVYAFPLLNCAYVLNMSNCYWKNDNIWKKTNQFMLMAIELGIQKFFHVIFRLLYQYISTHMLSMCGRRCKNAPVTNLIYKSHKYWVWANKFIFVLIPNIFHRYTLCTASKYVHLLYKPETWNYFLLNEHIIPIQSSQQAIPQIH